MIHISLTKVMRSNKSRHFINPLFFKAVVSQIPQDSYIPERKTAPAVVKHLDVVDDILAGSRSVEIFYPKDLLDLETAEDPVTALPRQSPFLLILESIP